MTQATKAQANKGAGQKPKPANTPTKAVITSKDVAPIHTGEVIISDEKAAKLKADLEAAEKEAKEKAEAQAKAEEEAARIQAETEAVAKALKEQAEAEAAAKAAEEERIKAEAEAEATAKSAAEAKAKAELEAAQAAKIEGFVQLKTDQDFESFNVGEDSYPVKDGALQIPPELVHLATQAGFVVVG